MFWSVNTDAMSSDTPAVAQLTGEMLEPVRYLSGNASVHIRAGGELAVWEHAIIPYCLRIR